MIRTPQDVRTQFYRFDKQINGICKSTSIKNSWENNTLVGDGERKAKIKIKSRLRAPLGSSAKCKLIEFASAVKYNHTRSLTLTYFVDKYAKKIYYYIVEYSHSTHVSGTRSLRYCGAQHQAVCSFRDKHAFHFLRRLLALFLAHSVSILFCYLCDFDSPNDCVYRRPDSRW